MKAPSLLKNLRGWLVWKFVQEPGGKKSLKVPFYINGVSRNGKQGGAADRANLASFDEAVAAFESGSWTGVGFAMLPDWGLVGLDFDNVVDPAGNLLPEVERLILGTYAEWSPSGKGVHAFMRGALADKKSCAKQGVFGFETFCSSGFLTFTGNVLPICEILGTDERIEELSDDVLSLFNERFPGASTRSAVVDDDDPLMTYSAPLDAPDDEIREWLSFLDPDMGYQDWLQVGMALHHETGGEARGLDLWDVWSNDSEKTGKYPGRELIEAKWNGFGCLGSRAPVTVRYIRRAAALVKSKDDVVLDAKDFVGFARRYIECEAQGDEGQTLQRVQGIWYRHVGSHWVEMSDDEMRASLWLWLDKSKKYAKEGTVEPFKPSKSQVESGLDALRAVGALAGISAPCWLPGYSGAAPHDLISVANGLFHVKSRQLLPHTPGYFNLNALPYPWDADARPQSWLAFLDQVFEGDTASIETLQEMFGYLITADTSQQKMFLLIGPKRSGKGTIGRILASLVGRSNLASPTLNSLASNFGMQPLINKLLALVPDARISGQSNTQAIVERLLMASGEDDMTIDRKNKEAWHGRISARFVVLTNETPQLGDASGALVGRFIILSLRQSFYGREDLGLSDRLIAEMPGILRWSLDGLDRLRQRGRFVQPASGQVEVEGMSALNSPIAAFVDEFCELGGEFFTQTSELYGAWRSWCSEQGRTQSWSREIFAKNLRAAFCGLKATRPRIGGLQKCGYAGIRVKHADFCELV